MSLEFLLFSKPMYFEAPQGLVGWLGLFALAGTTAYFLWYWRGYNKKKWSARQWITQVTLAFLTPLTSLFLAVFLPATGILPPPGKPVEPSGAAVLIFSAAPWVLAAGFLGPAAAAGLALLSGLALAAWLTHSPFTPLEMAFMAAILGALLNQRYRTPTFRTLSNPLAAVGLLALIYPLIFTVDILFMAGGTLANRLDYGFTRLGVSTLAMAIELLAAGVVALILAYAFPLQWGSKYPLAPSPAERKLETRFLYVMAPVVLLLLVLLMAGDWIVAGNSASAMLRDQMENTARTASDTVPFFIEAGENYIKQIAADPRLYSVQPADQLQQILSQDLRGVPFFRQLFLLDVQGEPITGYPIASYKDVHKPPEELIAIETAANGVPVQNYSIPPSEGDSAAQVSFIAAVIDDHNQVRRILIGRTELSTNPLTQPVLNSIRSMAGSDGEGLLLDNDGNILYAPNPARLMEKYTGEISESPTFFDEAAPDGTRQIVFYQPTKGQPWAIVLAVPARRAQQLALNIAAPLLGMVVLVFIFAILTMRFGLRLLTASLHNLSAEAKRIASGQLDHALTVEGEDEIGQLRRSFEQMRGSLKSRIDELNRLLAVSQGVASSLEISEAVKPVLESALSAGACSARIVLTPIEASEKEAGITPQARLGAGANTESYAYLDEQILELSRKQDRLILNNLPRVKALNFAPGYPRPESVLALALRDEALYYGTLWIAYDAPHPFTDDEIRFKTTLAGQAALAAANARLFQSAEIGRQRLAAILASTPDPVLVTDRQNRLLLSNPAAWQVLGLGAAESGNGQPIDKVTNHKDLIKLLRTPADEKQSAEVTLVGGRVFLATASSVLADGQRVGRVCLLRDVTHFKELDSLKSEFVSTVSHDLRSPLTLMRGYATMLEMVGELNEQQVGYVRKIIVAVESMSRLVNNLLDLNRIEAGIDLQLETVLVHDVIERVTGSLQLQATQKHIQLNVNIPPQTIPLIEADQALLHQALYNLVENAIKYTENGGKVDVSVQTRQEGLIFTVADSGIGVAPVDIPRLFEKFYRGAQREAKKQVGTGLGLAIVKSIAERHGGRVWVESQLGKGSTFYLAMPLHHPKAAATPTPTR